MHLAGEAGTLLQVCCLDKYKTLSKGPLFLSCSDNSMHGLSCTTHLVGQTRSLVGHCCCCLEAFR